MLGIWVGGEETKRSYAYLFFFFLIMKITAYVFFPITIYEIILVVACWSSAERKISFISGYSVHSAIWK